MSSVEIFDLIRPISPRSPGILIKAAVVLFLGYAAHAQPSRVCQLASSVQYKEYAFDDAEGEPIRAYVLEIDLTAVNTVIRPLVSPTGCRTTSQLGVQSRAIAAINGGFFNGSCQSVSLVKLDGQLLAANSKGRSALGIDALERLMIQKIPRGKDWPAARHALGGVPRIVTDGRVDVRTEGAKPDFIHGRHPRTAVGLLDDDRALFVVIDGRSNLSAGMNLDQLAKYMISLGARQAVNLDGGGSSEMWIDPSFGDADGVMNRPSDGKERKVASGLGVFAPPAAGTCADPE